MRKALEPYIKLAPFVGIGLVVVALVLVWILYMQRGAHMELEGSIQKVRTLALDENSTAVVIDFRLRNPSDYPFVVRQTEVTLIDPSGKEQKGQDVAEVDAKLLFQYYPVLGQKYNDSLLAHTRINAGKSHDAMLAVRFEIPETLVQQRRSLKVRVEDVDGPVAELTEGRRP